MAVVSVLDRDIFEHMAFGSDLYNWDRDQGRSFDVNFEA